MPHAAFDSNLPKVLGKKPGIEMVGIADRGLVVGATQRPWSFQVIDDRLVWNDAVEIAIVVVEAAEFVVVIRLGQSL